MKVKLGIPILAVTLYNPFVAYGYGFFAHKLIAKLTWHHLDPIVKGTLETVLPPGKTIASMASWPDTIKHRSGYEWTRSLHFAGLRDHPPHFCQTEEWKPVADLNVVSAALNYTLSFLTSYCYHDLAFAFHFLMDLHMPLHLSARDRGGLRVKLWDEPSQKSVSMHYVLDSLIFHRIVQTAPFAGSYRRFIAFLLKQCRKQLHEREGSSHCLVNYHDLEHCYEIWALKTNSLNCKYFWHVPADGTTSSYIDLQKYPLLQQVTLTALHAAEMLTLVFR